MVNNKNRKKISYIRIFSIILISAVVFSSGFFCSQNMAEAKAKKSSVTKWQKLLEKNGVPESLWAKYKPKVSKGEYQKAVKALKKLGSVSGSGTGSLGPNIRIGLFKLTTDNQKKVEIKSSGNFAIKNEKGEVVKNVSGGDAVGFKANKSDENFSIRQAGGIYSVAGDKLRLEPGSSDNVFEITDCEVNSSADKKTNPYGCYKTGSVKYDKYRGTLEIQFDKNGDPWLVNDLPLEQYTWGTGEIGESETEYYKLFSVVFRTYGYYNIEHTKSTHKSHNFNLSDTSLDQIYKGYRIEERYPKMKDAAQKTRGEIITYKNEVALTPYCSFTDGKTRDYPGDDFPYLKSVKDHKAGTDTSLNPGDNGNHMYGLSAHGAVGFIGDGKSYKEVLKHYYTGVDIDGEY
jgi:peptidoglycan hydrolase-like amidase